MNRFLVTLILALAAGGSPDFGFRMALWAPDFGSRDRENAPSRVVRFSEIRNPKSEIRNPLAVITFRPSAEVRGRIIHLGDVAAVEGADARLVASLEAVEVGTAPVSGYSRQVSAQYAKIRIRQSGVNVDRLLIGGPELVTVTRPEQRLPGAAIEKAACDAVETANPGASAQATFTPADVRLPVGAVELKPQAAPVTGSSSGMVPVQVLVDGRQEALVTVGFRLLRRAPAVVAARDLLLGTVLTAEDLRVEERPVNPGPLVLSEVSLAVGQQVALPIKGGTALTASMLRPAVILRRGTQVKLLCRGPNFTASVTGEALQDGVAGQPVRVRNLNSLLEVTGLVTDAQTVEVPF